MTIRPDRLYPGQIPAKLIDYFEANPYEELTVQEAMVKFGCRSAALSMAIRRLAGRLELVRVIRIPDGEELP